MAGAAAERGRQSGGQMVQVGAEVVVEARSPWELFWRQLKKDKVALWALGYIVFVVFVAILAPLIVKLVGVSGPDVQNSGALDSFGTPTGPS